MVRATCDDCDDSIVENHMGQSTHRCDYKQRSAEVAERLVEVFYEKRDYYTLFPTDVVLSFRHQPSFSTRTNLTVEGVHPAKIKNMNDQEWNVKLGNRFPLLNLKPGYKGWAHYYNGPGVDNRCWITDVDVEVDR